MKEIVEKINGLAKQFEADSAKALNGNRSAAARARKATLELAKLGKEYRALTIAEEKKK